MAAQSDEEQMEAPILRQVDSISELRGGVRDHQVTL